MYNHCQDTLLLSDSSLHKRSCVSTLCKRSRKLAKGPDFAIFWDFGILVNFLIFRPKMGPKGPGRASIGSRDGLRFIWTKFQPKWAHLGPNRAPFHFSISQKPILGPNSSKSSLGPGAIGPRAPSNMGSRAHGGRRPTFRRCVGGRSPPTATRGVWGGGSPPREKWTLELLPIAKSGTLTQLACSDSNMLKDVRVTHKGVGQGCRTLIYLKGS